MNVLYIISKKKFDLTLGKYIKNYAQVFFVASSPLDYLFFQHNGENPVKAYVETGRFLSDLDTPKVPDDLLNSIGSYYTSEATSQRRKIKRMFHAYTMFLEQYIKIKKIDICAVHERDFIDTAAAQYATAKCNIKIFYLSSGFFRGKTVTVAPERILFTDCQTWEERLRSFQPMAPDSQHGQPKNLSFIDRPPITPKKIPKIKELCIKASMIPDYKIRERVKLLRPRKNPLSATINRFKKKRIKIIKSDQINLPDRFILLPLQGNEILKETENIFNIKNMEDLASIAIKAVHDMNSEFGTNFELIIKEHPFRPFVISRRFIKHNTETIVLRKFDMQNLLDQTSLVLTYNSLAGFEALQKKRPVVMLGPLFYGLKGIVTRPSTIDNLPAAMYQAIHSETDTEKFEKLIRYLNIRYEVNANSRRLNSKDLYNITCRICGDPAIPSSIHQPSDKPNDQPLY